MPPWGAIEGLWGVPQRSGAQQEQIELVVDWIQNDAPGATIGGRFPRADVDFASPYRCPRTTPLKAPTLAAALVLDGLMPEQIPPAQSIRIVATLPNGSVEPLSGFTVRRAYRHPFLFRKAIQLPAGTVIRGPH